MKVDQADRSMTDSIALASVYRLQAVNFRLSAEKLSAIMETKDDGSPAKLTAIPIYFLVSHAVELFLKSALLKRGFTENDLKKYDYRHNLNSLLVALQEKGVSVTSDAVGMINGLHSQHQTLDDHEQESQPLVAQFCSRSFSSAGSSWAISRLRVTSPFLSHSFSLLKSIKGDFYIF